MAREAELVPAKVMAASFRVFEHLAERQQLIIKLLSPLDSFSISMVTTLIEKNVRIGSGFLDRKLLEIVMMDLVQQRVMVSLPEPTPFILRHDAHAKGGFAFGSGLMQRQVHKLLLEEERAMVRAHMQGVAQVAKAQLAKEADELKLAAAQGVRGTQSQGRADGSEAASPNQRSSAHAEGSKGSRRQTTRRRFSLFPSMRVVTADDRSA